MSESKYISSGTYQPLPILEGDKYHSWTVIRPLGRIKKWANHYWECKCDCGTIAAISGTNLINGKSKSCKKAIHHAHKNSTHGMRYTRVYATWRNMKRRCLNPNAEMYPKYGGRGIKVCDRWLRFESFWEDMKEGYSDDLTLERNDVNGNYCKENCRWATPQEQATNKTNTAYITYKGVTKRAHDWAALIGANPKSLSRRVYLGWTPEHCLFGKQYERIKNLILAENGLSL